MSELAYCVTFGPSHAFPNGIVMVQADTEAEARAMVTEVFGSLFSSIHPWSEVTSLMGDVVFAGILYLNEDGAPTFSNTLGRQRPDHPDAYVIWSNDRHQWWRPNRAGYTHYLHAAGRYGREEAIGICRDAALGWHHGTGVPPPEIPVRLADAKLALRSKLIPDEAG